MSEVVTSFSFPGDFLPLSCLLETNIRRPHDEYHRDVKSTSVYFELQIQRLDVFAAFDFLYCVATQTYEHTHTHTQRRFCEVRPFLCCSNSAMLLRPNR